MAVWGCKFDIFFFGGGGGGGGGRIFQIWGGGLSFLGLSFPDLLGEGVVFGSEFSRFGGSEVWAFKTPVHGLHSKAETQVSFGR